MNRMTSTNHRRPVATGLSRRNLLGLGGALGLGGLGLTACSDGEGTEPGEAGEPSGEGGQDFTFTSFALSEDPPKEWLEQTVADYASDEGISINASSYAYNEALNQMILQSRGGELSGVAHLDIAWLAPMVATGTLVDLSAYTSDVGYTDASLGTGQFDGVQYGIPWSTAAIGLIGNSELLEQAGVDFVPSTLTEFEEVLREVKSLGSDIVPYAASTEVAQLKDFIVWMQTFGSAVVEDGRCTVGDEASIEAMTWYKKLYTDGLIAPDIERSAARNLFSQGRTAYYDDAPIGSAIVVTNSPDAEIRSKMIPLARPVHDDGDVPQALAWGHILVVTDGEESTSGAEFAQWLTSDPEAILGYFGASSNPPATMEGLESSDVQEDEFLSAFTESITATATPSPFWEFTAYAQMETAVADSVQAVLLGNQTPEEGMRAAGEAVNGLIS
ncbi:ABC transporter substrate-binding protein [Ruania alba]|uniref:Carbohydrate ABC transporter substrate-binding protein, CUT1 family n=1 Tax=Ruania alba TaxID=648782 RepID=A0A1H5GV59_9MICO|nr:extracellular solute-binding protein [Ruania alba]SEE19560.1 carbohydrate ABC transporter substrate-binding protein, CUT1 family [Ruania alba]